MSVGDVLTSEVECVAPHIPQEGYDAEELERDGGPNAAEKETGAADVAEAPDEPVGYVPEPEGTEVIGTPVAGPNAKFLALYCRWSLPGAEGECAAYEEIPVAQGGEESARFDGVSEDAGGAVLVALHE